MSRGNSIEWTAEMLNAVQKFRNEDKLCIDAICEKVGVSKTAFTRARRSGLIKLSPIPHAKKLTIGTNSDA